MAIADFMRRRKDELGMSLSDMETQFNLRGYGITRASIGHWILGSRRPPVRDRRFLEVLAEVYKMSVPEILAGMGLMDEIEGMSPEARRAADIIEHMPPEQRKMALKVLEAMTGAQNA